MAASQLNNMDFILKSVHDAKEALLEWVENFEQDELTSGATQSNWCPRSSRTRQMGQGSLQ